MCITQDDVHGATAIESKYQCWYEGSRQNEVHDYKDMWKGLAQIDSDWGPLELII